jgi:hypothetical protein
MHISCRNLSKRSINDHKETFIRQQMIRLRIPQQIGSFQLTYILTGKVIEIDLCIFRLAYTNLYHENFEIILSRYKFVITLSCRCSDSNFDRVRRLYCLKYSWGFMSMHRESSNDSEFIYKYFIAVNDHVVDQSIRITWKRKLASNSWLKSVIWSVLSIIRFEEPLILDNLDD